MREKWCSEHGAGWCGYLADKRDSAGGDDAVWLHYLALCKMVCGGRYRMSGKVSCVLDKMA